MLDGYHRIYDLRMYNLFTKEAEVQRLADEPGEDEIDDRDDEQRDERIERTGTDEVTGTRQVGDSNIPHDGGVLQQRDTLACVKRQSFAQRLRKDNTFILWFPFECHGAQ